MDTEQPDNVEQPEPVAVDATVEANPSDEQRVPLDRFRAVTDENKTLRSELDELNRWKLEQEQAQLSEIERERQAREQAESELAAARERATRLERSQWVSNAAQAAGFSDPEDASLLLDLSDIEDADSAREAVKSLAERKPHLVGNSEPRPMGTPIQTSKPIPSDDPKAALGAELFAALRKR